jgi:hypothetical protein
VSIIKATSLTGKALKKALRDLQMVLRSLFICGNYSRALCSLGRRFIFGIIPSERKL